jgi:hypothetical protein
MAKNITSKLNHVRYIEKYHLKFQLTYMYDDYTESVSKVVYTQLIINFSSHYILKNSLLSYYF